MVVQIIYAMQKPSQFLIIRKKTKLLPQLDHMSRIILIAINCSHSKMAGKTVALKWNNQISRSHCFASCASLSTESVNLILEKLYSNTINPIYVILNTKFFS